MAITYKNQDSILFAALQLVRQSRQYGACYKPVNMPKSLDFEGGFRICFMSYGRSLQSRGHKYKGYALDQKGKPVKTKNLSQIFINRKFS